MNGNSVRMLVLGGLIAGPVAMATHEAKAQVPSTYLPNGLADHQAFSTQGWTEINVLTAGVQMGDVPDTVAKINAIIANNPTADLILKFPAGDYFLKESLLIRRSHVVLKGDGIGLTVLRIETPAEQNGIVSFVGGGFDADFAVTGAVARGATTLKIAGATGITAGSIVKIYDTSKAIGEGTNQRSGTRTDGSKFNFYDWQQIVRVKTIAADGTITTYTPIGLSFPSGTTRAQRINSITQVGFENMTVTRSVNPSADGTHNLTLRFVQDGYIKGVETTNLRAGGLVLAASYDVSVRDSSVHGAYAYGGGGQAYGILVGSGTSNCAVTNNKAWSLRHHILVSNGANHCIVSYNSTEPPYTSTFPPVIADLDQHGFTPHNNLWEGNIGSALAWDGRSTNGAAESQGLYNAAFRNLLSRVTNADDGGILIQKPNLAGNMNHYGLTIVANVIPAHTEVEYFDWNSTNNPINYTPTQSDIPRQVGANAFSGTLKTEAGSSVPVSGTFPASLYLSVRPLFLGTRPWPLFGPGVSGFGGANLVPAAESVIVDNADTNGFSVSGSWSTLSAATDWQTDYRYDTTTGADASSTFATFSPYIPATGNYDIYIRWPSPSQGSSRADAVPLEIRGNGGVIDTTKKANQTVGGNQWNLVGTYALGAGTGNYVKIIATDAGQTIADAVKFVKK